MEKGASMKRDLYDFITPPDTPKEAHTTMYYFPHQQKSGLGLWPAGPAFRELPCMVVHYDKAGNLLFTRFVFKDGTWRDEK
jgi:hypothetical protein